MIPSFSHIYLVFSHPSSVVPPYSATRSTFIIILITHPPPPTPLAPPPSPLSPFSPRLSASSLLLLSSSELVDECGRSPPLPSLCLPPCTCSFSFPHSIGTPTFSFTVWSSIFPPRTAHRASSPLPWSSI